MVRLRSLRVVASFSLRLDFTSGRRLAGSNYATLRCSERTQDNGVQSQALQGLVHIRRQLHAKGRVFPLYLSGRRSNYAIRGVGYRMVSHLPRSPVIVLWTRLARAEGV